MGCPPDATSQAKTCPLTVRTVPNSAVVGAVEPKAQDTLTPQEIAALTCKTARAAEDPAYRAQFVLMGRRPGSGFFAPLLRHGVAEVAGQVSATAVTLSLQYLAFAARRARPPHCGKLL